MSSEQPSGHDSHVNVERLKQQLDRIKHDQLEAASLAAANSAVRLLSGGSDPDQFED